MSDIKVSAPSGRTEIILKDGTVKHVDAYGLITIDESLLLEAIALGCGVPEDDVEYEILASDSGITLTPAQVIGAKDVMLERIGSMPSAGGSLTDTFPDASNWIAALDNYGIVGDYKLRYRNNVSVGSVMIFAGGSGVSFMNGGLSLAKGSWREFLVTRVAAGVEIYNIGGGTI